MTLGLDTSVVVRLLIGEPADQCERARLLVQTEFDEGRPVRVADIVVAETYFALRHHYGVPASAAIEALALLMNDKRIVGESAPALLAEPLGGLNDHFLDALIHRWYADSNCTFVTFDRKAARLAGSRLIKI